LKDDDYNRKLSYGFMVFLILSHSFLDFNMSYMYILGITMVLLALIEEPIDYPLHRKGSKRKNFTYITIIVIVLLSIISLFYTARFLYAYNIAKESTTMSANEAEGAINKAIALNPYELEYRFLKIDLHQYLYNQTTSDEYRQELLQETIYIKDSDPTNPNEILRLSRVLANNGYLNDSVTILDNAIKEEPWVRELYEQYFVYGYNLAEYYQRNGQAEEAEMLLNSMLKYYNGLLNKRVYLDGQPLTLQYKAFKSTPLMELYIGQTYIILSNYDDGMRYLTPLIKNNDQNIKKYAIAWAAYAYEKQNMNNQVSKLNLEGLDVNELKRIKEIWNK